jgi:hypothetical protein
MGINDYDDDEYGEDEYTPSKQDFDRNFIGSPASEEGAGLGEMTTSPDGIEDQLTPGIYRAIYAFVPEGTAEMALEEDQLVKIVGRGGGVGWAIAVVEGPKDGAADAGEETPRAGAHALVPESYLEFVRPFEPGEFDDEDQDQGEVEEGGTAVSA